MGVGVGEVPSHRASTFRAAAREPLPRSPLCLISYLMLGPAQQQKYTCWNSISHALSLHNAMHHNESMA